MRSFAPPFFKGRGFDIIKCMRKITKKMTIGEVMKECPRTAFVFIDYGLHCVGCPMVEPETIEEAAKLHRINLEKFLKDLNKVVRKK